MQRQWPFVPKSDTTWDGILVSWKKSFWSNKNHRQSKTAVTQDYIDCSDLPESINGQNFDPGCPGAVYEDGSPSYSYCNGIGYNNSYHWWHQCCIWDDHKCQPKDLFDCSVLPASMNGQDFGYGCPGAVYQDASPSENFCHGIGIDGNSYPWWKHCCIWNGLLKKCQPKEHFDCSDLPASMNGKYFDSGCPGAVYQDGSPSFHFCEGIGYNGTSYPWWKQCCFWNEYERICHPKPSSFTCPTDRSNSTSAFREIKGKCYHMTKGGCHEEYYGCTYQQAQDQCKTVFGSGISGYLFEPTTLEINNAVLKAAKDVMGHSRWFWIGVTNGDFRYRSNGKPVSIEPIPFGSDQPILTGSDTQCVGAVSGTLKWITPLCNNPIVYTICETNF